MAVLALLGAQGKTLAAPSGAEVVAGDAIVANHQTISGVNIDTLITQSSQRAVIDWASFDIGQDELVRFVQNGVDSVALNRITSGDATQILGQLQANGRLFLVNPSGIVFGSSAQVDVAGLVATTLDIDNTDFMKGEFAFEQTAVNDAEVRNEGTITIGDNGFAYLVAPNVDNSGTIVANLGRVGLATDGTYILDLQGNELIKFSVSPEVLEGSTLSVTNSGSGSLAGKTVVLAASGTETVLSSVVNDGDIQAATSFDMTGDRLTQAGHVEAGDIRLDAEAAIRQSGDMLATGQVDVDAGTDIMMTDGTTTRANGDIRYNADGSLQVANLTSQDGYIGLVADNDVTQTGDIVTTGTSVEVMAGTTAAGGPGSTGDIVMAEGTRTQAVDDIRYTAGRDLTVETLVSQPDDNVELRAGRTIYQNATITAAGQVDVDAGADIVMAGGTTTRTNGDIRYNADGNLQVANLTSRDGYIGLVADNDVTQTGDIVTTGTSV
ncbi:MAG: filamentous hemagglutinin N-terminal domain-containing protein, partial [Halomonas sp.]|nr:filamentous hemagglutinin N-terminal domain-containing protein [Halomonas sp.]